MDLYDGGLRAVDHEGQTIFDHQDAQGYADLIAEEVRSWSYMKFPTSAAWPRAWLVSRRSACAPQHVRRHSDTLAQRELEIYRAYRRPGRTRARCTCTGRD